MKNETNEKPILKLFLIFSTKQQNETGLLIIHSITTSISSKRSNHRVLEVSWLLRKMAYSMQLASSLIGVIRGFTITEPLRVIVKYAEIWPLTSSNGTQSEKGCDEDAQPMIFSEFQKMENENSLA
jgi:hypothetical protein